MLTWFVMWGKKKVSHLIVECWSFVVCFTALCDMHPMRALFLIPRNAPPRLKSNRWWVVTVCMILRGILNSLCSVFKNSIYHAHKQARCLLYFKYIWKWNFITKKSQKYFFSLLMMNLKRRNLLCFLLEFKKDVLFFIWNWT